jgi:hypothetical protein
MTDAGRQTATALWLGTLALLAINPVARAAPAEYRFDVYYDDKQIGDHRFLIEPADIGLRVLSEAEFEYRLLFVPVYRYRHKAEEVWRDGCLRELNATTHDNGRRFEVTGLTGLDQHACPASFAYWDLERLRRDSLINAQTGEPVGARLIREGDDSIAGEAADRYRLELDGMADITLWYRTGDQRWIGLESRREGGTLRYRAASEDAARRVGTR